MPLTKALDKFFQMTRATRLRLCRRLLVRSVIRSHFQERVVNALVAAGELEYARTFAERCSFSEADIASICSDEMMMQMRADRELRYYKLPENVNVSFVDDENSLKEMFEVLRTSTSIGIDTEWAAKLGDGLDSENESEETKDTEEDDAKMPPSKTARSTSNSLSETVALLQISSKSDCFLLDLPKPVSYTHLTLPTILLV